LKHATNHTQTRYIQLKMANYKIQHWLPAGYMKFFSLSGESNGRNSRIYYANSSECKSKKVKKLSCKNYHYSKDNAEKAETSFHLMENDYPLLIDKIIHSKELTKKEYFSLILSMIDYHARNPSYENLTIEENYKAYETVSMGLMREVFEDCDDCGKDFQKLMDFLADNWLLQPLCSIKDELFSSDHPSLLFSINNKIAFIILPINPHYALLAVDKRKIKITGNEINEQDLGMLNAYQAYHCVEYVYSNIDLSQELGENKSLTKWLKKDKPRGFVDNNSWKPEFIDYPDNMPSEFSFMEIEK
jgi:hypothetical protein